MAIPRISAGRGIVFSKVSGRSNIPDMSCRADWTMIYSVDVLGSPGPITCNHSYCTNIYSIQ